MAKTNVGQFSTTAGSNTDVDGSTTAEGWAPADINNAVRALMAMIAEWASDLNGADLTAAGTNTYTLATSGAHFAAPAALADISGLVVKFTNANTSAATLNVDSLGAVAIKKNGGAALVSGDIRAGATYLLVYDGTDFEIVGNVGSFASVGEDLVPTTDSTYDLGTSSKQWAEAHIDAGLIDKNTSNSQHFAETTAPSTAASEGALYTKDSGGQPELFFREESDGDEVQITEDGRLVSGAEYIHSVDASSHAYIEFTSSHFDATKYDAYMFMLQNVIPATDAVEFIIRTSNSGGAPYDNGATDYSRARNVIGNGGPFHNTSDGDTGIVVTTGLGSDTNEYGISGPVWLAGAHLTGYTFIQFNVGLWSSSGFHYVSTGGGAREEAAIVNAIQFIMSSGNIESGTITMYGLRNA